MPESQTRTPKILVSACLMGRAVRYDGGAKTLTHPKLEAWRTQDRLVIACPELLAGMSVPRAPAEIDEKRTGDDVLAGTARIVDRTGADVTKSFVQGARATLALAQQTGCRFALLIDKSPSCASSSLYDGSFTGITHPGAGVTAALLRRNGIAVFAPDAIDELDRHLAAAG